MTNRTGSLILCLWASFIFVFGGMQNVLAYGTQEHHDIGYRSQVLFAAYQAENPTTTTGSDALGTYWSLVDYWLEHEDDTINMYYLKHFYDPVTGNGLWVPGTPVRQKSAVVYANELLVILETNYAAGISDPFGNAEDDIYPLIGRIAHLVMDMGVPAHVQLDPHMAWDYYETIYISNPANHPDTSAATLHAGSLTQLMNWLAVETDQFDSSDDDGTAYWGTGYAPHSPGYYCNEGDGWTPAKAQEVAQVCYSNAVSAAAGFFKCIFGSVHPSAQIIYLLDGSICSGINGIIIGANGTGFLYGGHQTPLSRAIFDFYAPTFVPVWWPISSGPFTYKWYNNLNDANVQVRAFLQDHYGVSSISAKVTIKIDSIPPVISNTKP